jgi:hypothetical protein
MCRMFLQQGLFATSSQPPPAHPLAIRPLPPAIVLPPRSQGCCSSSCAAIILGSFSYFAPISSAEPAERESLNCPKLYPRRLRASHKGSFRDLVNILVTPSHFSPSGACSNRALCAATNNSEDKGTTQRLSCNPSGTPSLRFAIKAGCDRNPLTGSAAFSPCPRKRLGVYIVVRWPWA